MNAIRCFPSLCCSTVIIRPSWFPLIAGARCVNNVGKSLPTATAIFTRCYSGITPTPGRRRNIKHFLMAMTQEEKDRKLKEIEKMRLEAMPQGLFAKLKYYFKRYWYIAIPVHTVCCSIWLAVLYVAVKSGVDVIALLKWLHIPNNLIEKVKNIPESAGVLVVALLLYKIALPFRYMTSLAGIQLTFWTLRRLGKLKTVREVEYGVRTGIEKSYEKAIRRLNQRRNRSAMISPYSGINTPHHGTLSKFFLRKPKQQHQPSTQSSPSSKNGSAGSNDANK